MLLVQFAIPDEYILLCPSISTYVSLFWCLSIINMMRQRKIYKVCEKYSQLHNQIEHRMDVLDPGMIPNFGAMLMLKLSLGMS